MTFCDCRKKSEMSQNVAVTSGGGTFINRLEDIRSSFVSHGSDQPPHINNLELKAVVE